MLESPSPPPDRDTPEPRLSLVVVLCAVLGGVFFVNEQNFDLALGRLEMSLEEYRAKSFTADPNDTEDAIEQGSNLRRVAFPMLGCVGFGLLLIGDRPVQINGFLLALIAAFMLWCLASIGWSAFPTLTAKRLIVLTTCVAGIFGVARILTLRELAMVTLGISLAFVAISLLIEFRFGVFTPWVGTFRFAGLVHPNTQASYCALLLMSSFALGMMSSERRTLCFFICLVALVLLALTKSRSTFAGAVVSLFVVWSLLTTPARRTVALFSAPFVVLCLVGYFVLGQFSSGDLEQAAQLGREGEATIGGLNGRIPLWIYLLKPISESPVLGYGYDTFWVPQQIHKATAALEWTVPNSHNVFVETQLNLGLVGATLFIVLGFCTLAIIFQRLIRERDVRLALPATMGLFGAMNAVFEASYSQPTGVDSFLACCALTIAAVMPTRSPAGKLSEQKFRPVPPPSLGWGRPSCN